ncbi:unnamed protein product, partial [Rotaria sp. Silwood1]
LGVVGRWPFEENGLEDSFWGVVRVDALVFASVAVCDEVDDGILPLITDFLFDFRLEKNGMTNE